MAKAKAARVQRRAQQPAFDAKAFLDSVGAARRAVNYAKGKTIFVQGEPSDAVMYIQKGSIKISQETLAEMVGTTRSRVNFFMNKFRDFGVHRIQR